MIWRLIQNLLADGALAAVAGLGFALISNPPRKALPCIAALAAVGHAARYFFMWETEAGIAASSLFAAFLVGLGGVLFSRLLRLPAEFFCFPALLPMIPGMYAYKSILSLMRFMQTADEGLRASLLVDIAGNGFTTFFVMCALVIGVLMPLLAFDRRSYLSARVGPLLAVIRRRSCG